MLWPVRRCLSRSRSTALVRSRMAWPHSESAPAVHAAVLTVAPLQHGSRATARGRDASRRRAFTTGARNTLLPSCADAIGDTPLVELSRICSASDVNGRILAKLENLNPGLSKKDRIALQILRDAIASGDLAAGQTVVELTSGNTGTGLSIACAVHGHPFVAVMSKGNSVERARMMRALGAEVVLVDQTPDSVPGQVSGKDLELVEVAAQAIVEERDAFRADQFALEGSYRAHFLHTGPECWQQSNGAINAFVDFAGSGGSFVGVADFLKQQRPDTSCYIVEPHGVDVLAGRSPDDVGDPNHKIQGGGYAMAQLPLLERAHRRDLVDGYMTVTSEEAAEGARRLAREEGVFAGFSSGANLHAALSLLRTPEGSGKTVLIMVCDSGLKYLSTDLFE